MRTHSKLILAALAAIMLLAIAVAGANARSLRVGERNFELIWNPAFGAPKSKLSFVAGGRTAECNVTMGGHFNEATIKKETAASQITITHSEVEGCVNGTVTVRTESLPWVTHYRGFEGTLPRIRSITIGILGVRARIRESGGLECEVGTEANHPGVVIAGNTAEDPESGLESTGEAEAIMADRTARIPLGGGFLCSFAGEGTISGLGLIRNLPRTAKIRFTLI